MKQLQQVVTQITRRIPALINLKRYWRWNVLFCLCCALAVQQHWISLRMVLASALFGSISTLVWVDLQRYAEIIAESQSSDVS